MTKYVHKIKKENHEQVVKAWENSRPEPPTAYEAKEVKKTHEVDTPSGKAIAQEGDFILSSGNEKFVVHADDLENMWVESDSG